MNSLDPLLSQARQYGLDHHLPYAGALPPEAAWQLLERDAQVRLVDVRTRAELDWVGRPQIAAGQYLHIEWSTYPGGAPNPDFMAQLQSQADPDAPLLFLCRSAVRSKAAAQAATAAGYPHCFDILEGFEGDRDAQGHRKTVAGWCWRGLPWQGA
jgi:rhodanese-related sulfurtransferase